MNNTYDNPLITRYASEDIKQIFSPQRTYSTWRKLWTALAEAERELGLDISEEQISELRDHTEDIDFEQVENFERETKHDVMAHIKAYGLQCPAAKGIIHLGATSAFVKDNTDIILYKEALLQIKSLLITLIDRLSAFAKEYKAMPTLGYTHMQPAQLTTVGKRATLWIQDLLTDLEDLDYLISTIKLRGVKGTTGTQASFLDLFNDDADKVLELDQLVVEKMGFDSSYPVTGQTYPRKLDSRILAVLSGIAQTLTKFATDLRLLQHLKEIEEPFETEQVGSSAMAYKRNPMRSERICSLARYVMVESLNPVLTQSNQWFERTLDDSANKRITIPQAFLATDAILSIAINIASNLVVYEEMIKKHINEELPFMITENIIMEGVKKGKDRQELHERIRVLSQKAGENVKKFGKPNNLIELIAEDESFGLSMEDLEALLKPENYIGIAEKQVDKFLEENILPRLEKDKDYIQNASFEFEK